MNSTRNRFALTRWGVPLVSILVLAAILAGGMGALELVPQTNKPESSPSFAADSRQVTPSVQELLQSLSSASPAITVAEKIGPTVVGVTRYGRLGITSRSRTVSGSGIIIDGAKGLVVTNYHVVQGFSRLVVTLDPKREYQAQLVGGDPYTDLAVLRVDAPPLPQAILGDSAQLRVGEMVAAIGNPLGSQFARSVTVGVVSALDREIAVESRPGHQVSLKVIQTDAAINPGNSGGALVNARGEVIGINSVKISATGVEGMGFAIPINDARPVIDQLITGGRVRRPHLGISSTTISPLVSTWYKVPAGLLIESVVPGQAAALAGVRPGDLILALDGQPVATTGELNDFLARHRPGDRVKVSIARGRSRVDLNAVLGEAL